MIRPATPADAAGIARVQVDTWRAAYPGLVPGAVLAGLNAAANTARWAELVADPVTRTWVAVTDGEVSGFLAGGPARDGDLDAAAYGEVYAVYVLPSAQGQGLGRGLLDAADGWFAEHGRTAVALWVLTANVPSRTFYEHRGFTADGAARTIDIGGTDVPEVRYARNLPAVRALS
ncbi:MAG TPA: GNAT family N-acetyltransferase [Frankiaceae bacterium]|nr:GNAT family N-acetyltransferase [Frankiaceae bacterium]